MLPLDMPERSVSAAIVTASRPPSSTSLRAASSRHCLRSAMRVRVPLWSNAPEKGRAMALSIPDLLRDRVGRTPDAEAMRYRADGGWVSLSWSELQGRVAREAFGLRAKGRKRGDRVALMGRTSIEWIITDLAVLAAGGATTTIYPNSTAGEVAHIVGDSGSRIVVVETDE